MIIKIDDTQMKIFAKMCKDAPKSFNAVTAEYLNASAFRHRELNIKSLESKMVIRDKRFLLSSLRVEKTRPLPIDKQIAISGSINRPRFSGWKEQETGQTPKRKHAITTSARGGNIRSKVQEKNRLRASNIYTPKQFAGRNLKARFQFMMRMIGSRGGGNFYLNEKIPTAKGHLSPGLYNISKFKKATAKRATVYGKITLLQKQDKSQDVKRIQWQSKDWAEIKRRAEYNSQRALEIWKAKQAAKGLV